MRTVTRPHTSRGVGGPGPAHQIDGQKLVPVKWWAALGALFLTLFAYTWARWLLAGPTRTRPGPTPFPTWQITMIHAFEAMSVVGFVLAIWLVTIRPWRKQGYPTAYGLMMFAGLGAYWQDSFFSYFRQAIVYNSHFVNFGSWFEFIPGWVAPGMNHMPEPILWNWPLFGVYFSVGGVMGCFFMRRARARWPAMGDLGIFAISCLGIFAFEFISEGAWLRTRAYAYIGVPGLTLFKGHYYQFPMVEAVLFTVMWAAFGPLFFFRDDKGLTVVERGIDKVRATPKQKIALRALALCAAGNLIYLCLFNIPFALVNAHGDRWSEDIVKRSYLTGGVCGPGTTTACPDGKLVVLPGTRFPTQP